MGGLPDRCPWNSTPRLKDLAKARPIDWVTYLDQPPTGPVELLTPDLLQGLLVVPPTSSSAFAEHSPRTSTMAWTRPYLGRSPPAGMTSYQQYRLPVRTIVILPWPQANCADLTGR